MSKKSASAPRGQSENTVVSASRAVGGEGRQPPLNTDAQGYLRDPADWSEAFVCAQAEREGLRLTARHWSVIRHLRRCFDRHELPMACLDLDTILYFRARWPRAAGQPRWFPGLFPDGGLSRQGHRLAGLPRGDQTGSQRLDA